MDRKDFKIIFLGTPEFACKTLQALFDNNYHIVAVATQPDKPVGRKQVLKKSAIKMLAEKKGISVVELEKLADLKPDLGVLFAYGKIIPAATLKIFRLGILNIHPSLLPKYRGPSPVQAAILAGDKITGVTIIKLDEKIDHGPVVARQEVKIAENETAEKLLNRLAKVGSNLLIKILPDYLASKIKLQPQNDRAASYTKQIKREDGQINWQKSATQIMRQFRACHPWPGIYTHWQGKRLKIVKLSVLERVGGTDLAPGTVFLSEEGELAVVCGESAIVLGMVQLEGKKEMSGLEFLRGQKKIIGEVLR